MDLVQGNRLPQTLTQLGKPEFPCHTLVLMDLNGISQPVSLLTPDQCLAAGLKLAKGNNTCDTTTAEPTPNAHHDQALVAIPEEPDVDKEPAGMNGNRISVSFKLVLDKRNSQDFGRGFSYTTLYSG